MSIDRPLRENREQGYGASRRVLSPVARPARPVSPLSPRPHRPASHGDDRGEPVVEMTANDVERARERGKPFSR